MNMPLVAVFTVLLCLFFAFGLSDSRVFAALPESILRSGVAIAQFLGLLLILAGLWRLIRLAIAKARAEYPPSAAADASQRLPSTRRLNGWQRIGIVLTVGWIIGVGCLASFALVDKHLPSIGVIAGWMLVPPFAGWILVYVGVIVVRWTAAGFRAGER